MNRYQLLGHPRALRRAIIRAALGLGVMTASAIVTGQPAWALVGIISPTVLLIAYLNRATPSLEVD
jgi:hypothetical protein